MRGPRRGITSLERRPAGGPLALTVVGAPEHSAAGTALHQRATGLAPGVTSAAVQPVTPLLPQPRPLFIASLLDSVQLSLGTSYCYVNMRCNTYQFSRLLTSNFDLGDASDTRDSGKVQYCPGHCALCLYALWSIRDILLVFCMYLMTYYIGSIVVAFLVFYETTLVCAKVTVKMTFYSH